MGWVGLNFLASVVLWVGFGSLTVMVGSNECVRFIVARHPLCTSGSYALSERDFSAVGHTLIHVRPRLSDSKVEAIKTMRRGLHAGLSILYQEHEIDNKCNQNINALVCLAVSGRVHVSVQWVGLGWVNKK